MEWTVLQEIGFRLPGTSGEEEASQVGDNRFYRISGGDHNGKLVQNLGANSIIEVEEGAFIKWIIHEELKEYGELF